MLALTTPVPAWTLLPALLALPFAVALAADRYAVSGTA